MAKPLRSTANQLRGHALSLHMLTGGDLTLALALHRGCPRPGQQSSRIVLPILAHPMLLSPGVTHALKALNALTSTLPNPSSNVLMSERIPNCFPYRRPSITHWNGCFQFCYSMKIYLRKTIVPHRANLKQLVFPFHLSRWKLGLGFCKPTPVLHILELCTQTKQKIK